MYILSLYPTESFSPFMTSIPSIGPKHKVYSSLFKLGMGIPGCLRELAVMFVCQKVFCGILLPPLSSVHWLKVNDWEMNEEKMSGNWAKMCQETVRNVRNLAPFRRVDTLKVVKRNFDFFLPFLVGFLPKIGKNPKISPKIWPKNEKNRKFQLLLKKSYTLFT